MKTTTRSRWILDLHNLFYDLHCKTFSILTCDLMMAQKKGPKHVATLNKQNIYDTSCVSTCLNLFLARTYKHSEDNSSKDSLEFAWYYLEQ